MLHNVETGVGAISRDNPIQWMSSYTAECMSRPSSPRCTFGITRVYARNFRSIASTRIELDALTVLVGPNASGKSNVLDIFRFIGDSLRFDLETAVSRRHGFDRIRRRQPVDDNSNCDMEVGLKVEISDYSLDYSFVITEDFDHGYRLQKEIFRISHMKDDTLDLTIEDREPSSDTLSLTPSMAFDVDDLTLSTNNFELSYLNVILHSDQKDIQKRQKYHMRRALRLFHEHVRDLYSYHVFPNRIREPQRPVNRYPLDENGGNIASVLRDMANRHPEAMASLRQAIGHLIPSVSQIRVELIGGFLVVELGHRDPTVDSTSWFDLYQESDGTLRLLGLLTILHQHPHLPFIGIEEPEFAIHPGALAGLAECLEEASETTQMVITTHSPDLIDQFSVDSLRVVDTVAGVTTIGNVSKSQIRAVRENLFSPGDLHRMEGLRQAELE